MTWLQGPPQPGDWVRTTRIIKHGFADYVAAGGIRPGAQGVVIRSIGGRSEVELDGGIFGTVTIRVANRDLRIVRRDGGYDGFRRRRERLNAVRWGVAIALAAPFVVFSAEYLAGGGSIGALPGALALAGISAMDQLLVEAFSHPLSTALFVGAMALASRFAWSSV